MEKFTTTRSVEFAVLGPEDRSLVKIGTPVYEYSDNPANTDLKAPKDASFGNLYDISPTHEYPYRFSSNYSHWKYITIKASDVIVVEPKPILFDPDDPRAAALIGKRVYYGDSMKAMTSGGRSALNLISVQKESAYPFSVSDGSRYNFIQEAETPAEPPKSLEVYKTLEQLRAMTGIKSLEIATGIKGFVQCRYYKWIGPDHDDHWNSDMETFWKDHQWHKSLTDSEHDAAFEGLGRWNYNDANLALFVEKPE